MNDHLTDADIIDYEHHELDADADARALGHLSECARCRLRVEREAELTERIRTAALAETRELPQSIAEFVRRSVAQNAAEPRLAPEPPAAPRKPRRPTWLELFLPRISVQGLSMPASPQDAAWSFRWPPTLEELRSPMFLMPAAAAAFVAWSLLSPMFLHTTTSSGPMVDVRTLAQLHAMTTARAAFAERAVPFSLESADESGTTTQSALLPAVIADFDVAF